MSDISDIGAAASFAAAHYLPITPLRHDAEQDDLRQRTLRQDSGAEAGEQGLIPATSGGLSRSSRQRFGARDSSSQENGDEAQATRRGSHFRRNRQSEESYRAEGFTFRSYEATAEVTYSAPFLAQFIAQYTEPPATAPHASRFKAASQAYQVSFNLGNSEAGRPRELASL